ncbi:MAG: glycosyl transferase family protein [Pseudomonadota bacterium]
MSLAAYVRAMGRGPSRGRSLTREEAAEAMVEILSGTAAPEAVGAILMLMRYRGETAGEVAGFTDAARVGLTPWQDVGAALDWPSYAAGRSRGLPWFLLSAMLVARAGYPVLLHGWNSHQNPIAEVREAVRALSIPVTGRPDCAQVALNRQGIAYVPLESMSPRLLAVLRLRDVLGLRSAVNTVCRMLNPTATAAMVQGVFHPSYRALQLDAGNLLGQPHLTVIKGGGGEFERHPAKACEVYRLASNARSTETLPPLLDAHRRLADQAPGPADLLGVWTGHRTDPWAEAVVTSTAALALGTVNPALDPAAAHQMARALWQGRHQKQAA